MALALSFGARASVFSLLRAGWWRNSITGRVVQGMAGTPPDRTAGWSWSATRPADTAPSSTAAAPPLIAKPMVDVHPIVQLLKEPAVAPVAQPEVVAAERPVVDDVPDDAGCHSCGEDTVQETPSVTASDLDVPPPASTGSVETAEPASPATPPAKTPTSSGTRTAIWVGLGVLGVVGVLLVIAAIARPSTR